MIRGEVCRARQVIDPLYLRDDHAVLQVVGRQLARQIVEEVKFYAVVEEADVFLYRGRADDLYGEAFEAVWAPDPRERGVELRGGPRDGEVVPVQRADGPGGAFPPLRIVMPVGAFNVQHEPEGLTASLETVEYERAGIDDRARRFVYEVVR